MKSAKKTFEENLHNFGSGVVDEVLHGSGHHRGVDEIQERRHPGKYGGVGTLTASHAKACGPHQNEFIGSIVHHQGTATVALAGRLYSVGSLVGADHPVRDGEGRDLLAYILWHDEYFRFSKYRCGLGAIRVLLGFLRVAPARDQTSSVSPGVIVDRKAGRQNLTRERNRGV